MMKRLNFKWFLYIFIFAVIILFLITNRVYADKNSDAPYLKVGISKNFLPQYSVTPKGKPYGIATDVIEEISKLANFKIHYKIYNNWFEMFADLEKGELDLIPNMGITKERASRFSFSRPVEIFPISIFTRSNDHTIKNISDLYGKKVALVNMNVGKSIAEKLKLDQKNIFDNPETALLSLLSGNSDAMIFPEPVLWNMAEKANISDKIKVIGKPLLEIKRAVAVTKNNPNLLKRIDSVIEEFIKSERYKKIYIKWYATPEPYWTSKKIIYLFSFIILIVIFLMSLWRYWSIISINKKLLKNIEKRVIAEQNLHDAKNNLENLVKERTSELSNVNEHLTKEMQERKKLEAQYLQSQKLDAIGVLAGGIAHDFNNMLAVIIGNLSEILTFCEKDLELRQIVLDAQSATQQATSLTYQLLTFSSGGVPVKESNDINKLLYESVCFVLRGANSEPHFDLQKDLFLSEFDAGQMNQVITNIVINADQSMPNGGIIKVTSSNVETHGKSFVGLPAGKYIKIDIEDQGCGIKKSEITKIFDPYYSNKKGGHGLGLATTYSIIKNHGGNITLDSEYKKGTIFHIYIPGIENTNEETNYEINEEKNEKIHGETRKKKISKKQFEKAFLHQGHGRILLMDDKEEILVMLGRILKKMGYQAVCTFDGKQAIEEFSKAYNEKNPFDLVILDLTVPGGVGGAATLPELLKIDPNIRVVVSSGYSNDPVMANYREHGFCAVMPKPYSIQKLSKILDSILK